MQTGEILRLPVCVISGWSRHSRQNRYITDSAASGTAYATGHKTNNGSLGVDSEGNVLSNMTEILSSKGYATGIVTTDKISGATPAAFYAHQPQRSMTREILSDLFARRLFLSQVAVSRFLRISEWNVSTL